MKKTTIGLMAIMLLCFASCKKNEQTPPVAKDKLSSSMQSLTVSPADNLIAYKNSPHKLAVGYFFGLEDIGNTGADYANLALVPDSMDMVCIFGNMNHNDSVIWSKSATIKADIAGLHAKGTKVFADVWLNGFSDYKHADGTPYQQTAADYDSFALSTYNYFVEWGLDGIALDMEPGLVYTSQQNLGLLTAFAKYFGLKSATGKALILDTNQGAADISSSMGLNTAFINANVNYIWIMDYFGSTSSSDSKIDGYATNGYSSNNILDIGADFQADYNSTSTSLGPLRLQNYYTNPKYLAKVGGFGAYGFNYDEAQNYKYMRAMIQALNPASGNGIVSGATYQIFSIINNTSVLDVTAGNTANGTKVELWGKNSPVSNNQKWTVTSVGNGYYSLQPVNAPASMLDVNGAGTTDGTQVQIYTANGTNAQKWKINNAAGGYYTLSPACAPGSCLDDNAQGTANGTKIQIWTSNGTVAQQWKFVLQ